MVSPNLTNWVHVSHILFWSFTTRPNLFLLHELGVGAVVDDILTKDRGRQMLQTQYQDTLGQVSTGVSTHRVRILS